MKKQEIWITSKKTQLYRDLHANQLLKEVVNKSAFVKMQDKSLLSNAVNKQQLFSLKQKYITVIVLQVIKRRL